MTPPNESITRQINEVAVASKDEVAAALKAIARPHPTDPTVTVYERNGNVIAWDRAPRDR